MAENMDINYGEYIDVLDGLEGQFSKEDLKEFDEEDFNELILTILAYLWEAQQLWYRYKGEKGYEEFIKKDLYYWKVYCIGHLQKEYRKVMLKRDI